MQAAIRIYASRIYSYCILDGPDLIERIRKAPAVHLQINEVFKAWTQGLKPSYVLCKIAV